MHNTCSYVIYDYVLLTFCILICVCFDSYLCQLLKTDKSIQKFKTQLSTFLQYVKKSTKLQNLRTLKNYSRKQVLIQLTLPQNRDNWRRYSPVVFKP